YIPLYLKKAKVVCTVSEFLKQDIIRQYKISEEKIWNVGSAANPVFQPIDWQERENIKDNFSNGCEYFVFIESGYSEKTLINLVKAFSIFKKWQKTNMKLLLAEKFAYQYKDFVEKLKTYKYRDEVKVLGFLPGDELAKVVAAAYALVLPTLYEGFSVYIVEAMQCDVPVITSDNRSNREIAGEAALYANPLNPEEIAAQMKMIFKDEQLRSKLIDKGRIRVQNFTWERTVQLMWKSIEQAVSK
ncbi:MAG: glycosyltransferase family 4 protein, partial [Segetibacter sp.]|nr:glycosyltransferase family 4 protein [Segetibacter sp.]